MGVCAFVYGEDDVGHTTTSHDSWSVRRARPCGRGSIVATARARSTRAMSTRAMSTSTSTCARAFVGRARRASSTSTRARRGGFLSETRVGDADDGANDERARTIDDDARACACGSGETYATCCRVMHRGGGVDRAPEATMRARFAAYVVGDAAYVAASAHASSPDRARASLLADAKRTIKNITFHTFTLKRSTPGRESGEYFVAYEATFTKGRRGRRQTLAERARLRRDEETGGWKFVDAVALNANTLDDVGGDVAGGARR